MKTYTLTYNETLKGETTEHTLKNLTQEAAENKAHDLDFAIEIEEFLLGKELTQEEIGNLPSFWNISIIEEN